MPEMDCAANTDSSVYRVLNKRIDQAEIRSKKQMIGILCSFYFYFYFIASRTHTQYKLCKTAQRQPPIVIIVL